LTKGALHSVGAGFGHKQLEILGLIDSWDDAAGTTTARGLSLTNASRIATGGPSSEPAIESGGGDIASYVFNPGDIIQIEVDVRSVSGGGSFFNVVTAAGTFNINPHTDNTWRHYRNVFTVGSTGYLRFTAENTIRFANLFIYKVTTYPIYTTWESSISNTTLSNGETFSNVTRNATGGRFNDAYLETNGAGGPTTLLSTADQSVGQVFRIEAVLNVQSGGGTELQAVVDAGTTVINSNNTIGWQFFSNNVTIGASLIITIKNTFTIYIQDFKIIQIGA
jgi:hypothetical protein